MLLVVGTRRSLDIILELKSFWVVDFSIACWGKAFPLRERDERREWVWGDDIKWWMNLQRVQCVQWPTKKKTKIHQSGSCVQYCWDSYWTFALGHVALSKCMQVESTLNARRDAIWWLSTDHRKVQVNAGVNWARLYKVMQLRSRGRADLTGNSEQP